MLAKKLFYRGSALTPRDLFDWWTVETLKPALVQKAEMGRLLESKRQGILKALELLPRSTAAARLWDGIFAPDKPDMPDVAAWGRDALGQYQQASMKMLGQKLEVKRLFEYWASKPARSVPSADEPSTDDGPEP
ncbi:hypothetical protein [Solilutibacter pythonis]|uniref:hypothetical protein n=1 Tax=Solilutibacter pythonis TaxID=2483112 RepID=UPI001FEA05AF|nr:hypothetical protein [Lysobacter pythonis]